MERRLSGLRQYVTDALQTFLQANAEKPAHYGEALRGMLSLPQRAVESAGSLQRGGSYDPAPVLEAATLGMGIAPAGTLGAGFKFGELKRGLASDPNYVYHATNTERAADIAQGGLKTHRPHEFTDQSVWPDGSIEKRNYFTPTAENTWQFAPEEGRGVMLRIKRGPDIKTERTGDLFSKNTIAPERIEVLGADGQYHPISKLLEE